jgi:hypothetical protein
MQFNSSFDRITKGISAFASVFMVIAIVGFYLGMRAALPVQSAALVTAAFGLLMGVLLSVAFLYSPAGKVSIDRHSGNLTIGRRVKPLIVPRTDIGSVRTLTANDTKGMMRVFGNGGWFGWAGLYWSQSLGRFSLVATKLRDYVLVETTAGRRFVFSVDDPHAFVRAIHQVRGQ